MFFSCVYNIDAAWLLLKSQYEKNMLLSLFNLMQMKRKKKTLYKKELYIHLDRLKVIYDVLFFFLQRLQSAVVGIIKCCTT